MTKYILSMLVLIVLASCGGSGGSGGSGGGPVDEEDCSLSNLNLCQNTSDCNSVGGYWYDNQCHDTANNTSGNSGELDSSFGDAGLVEYDINSGSDIVDRIDEVGYSSVVDSSTGIIYSTGVTYRESYRESAELTIWSYLSDGTLNASFGDNGVFYFDSSNDNESFNDQGWDILIHNNKLYVTGESGLSYHDADLIICCVTMEGELDLSFGSNGIVRYDHNQHQAGTSIVFDDNSFLIGGNFIVDDYSQYVAVWKYSLDGTLVSSFGTDGVISQFIIEDYDQTRCRIAIDSNQDIILISRHPIGYLYLWKFDKNGVLLSDFGEGGRAHFLNNYAVRLGHGNYLEVDTYDNIYVGGTSNRHAIVIKYTSNGVLDDNFGNDGVATVNEGHIGDTSSGHSLIIHDDVIYVAGRSSQQYQNLGAMSVWGFLLTGDEYTSWGDDGVYRFHRQKTHSYGHHIMAYGDDLLVTGQVVDTTYQDGDFAMWLLKK